MNDAQTVPENDELEIVFAEISGEVPSTGAASLPADDIPFEPIEHADDDGECDDDGELDALDAWPEPAAPGLLERFSGLVAALSSLAFFMMLDGLRPGLLLQQTAGLGMIAGVTLGGLISSHGPRRVAQLASVLFGGWARDDEHAYELRDMCLRGRRLCYATALVVVVLGAIDVLSALDQPSRIGAAIALSLTALIQGTLLAELLFGSAVHWVRARRY